MEKNQKCWLCRKTKLIPTENVYEIMVDVNNKPFGFGWKADGWKRMSILCCDLCLESLPELADAEVLGFGDGIRLPVESFMEG